jgi:hypothetical protein
MRTILTQKHIALMIEEFVNREGAECGAILFSHFPDETVGAVVNHQYEFELPTNWTPPDE